MSQLNDSSFLGIGCRGTSTSFPDPFMDMASMVMPDSIRDSLQWCERIVMANGVYREAISRVVSYFITDVEIVNSGAADGDKRIGHEEEQKYLDFLNDVVGIKSVLRTVALDYLIYGNSFTSLLIPFRRYLNCPAEGCGFEAPLRKVFNNAAFGFSWSNFQFHATCPRCGYSGPWRHVDRRSGESGRITVKRWPPEEIDILWDLATGDTAYIWKIPDDYRNDIRRGDSVFKLERASWEVVEAIRDGQNLLFDPDVIYHMKEDTLAGLHSRGWGLSKVLTNFRQAYYVQVLHRYNEAIALDHVMPFRVITPQPRPGQGGEINDPVLQINMGSFVQRVNAMLRRHRRDPGQWNVLPYPVEYSSLGGDATKLAPKDLLAIGMETLLAAIGIPPELYQGSLTTQAAPVALRLFEANWSHLVHQLNQFLTKLVDKIAQVMAWEPVNCRLQRVTHADEERRKLEEERISAEATQDMQKEMEQAALMDEMAAPPPPPDQGGAPAGAPAGDPAAAGGAQQMPQMQGMPGAMPGGGMPPVQPAGAMGQPAGAYGAAQTFAANQPLIPNKPTTPEEMEQMAQVLAQQAMAMPDSQRKSFLMKLKKEDETIHALVKSFVEEYRRDAQLRGGEMVMQQEMGKQAAARYPATVALRSILD